MVGGKNSRRDDISVVADFPSIYQTRGKNSGCSGFELYCPILTEDPSEDVFVITNGDDALEN